MECWYFANLGTFSPSCFLEARNYFYKSKSNFQVQFICQNQTLDGNESQLRPRLHTCSSIVLRFNCGLGKRQHKQLFQSKSTPPPQHWQPMSHQSNQKRDNSVSVRRHGNFRGESETTSFFWLTSRTDRTPQHWVKRRQMEVVGRGGRERTKREMSGINFGRATYVPWWNNTL